MLVKKKNPEWKPSENPDLKVGETIDITDPKQLIVNGIVVGVSEDGVELSAYDLYGVLVKDELEEFRAYKQKVQQEALKEQLEKQKEELEAKLATVQTAETKPQDVPAEIKAEVKKAVKKVGKKK